LRITEILLENQIDAVGCIVFAIDSNRFLVSLRSSSKHLDSPGTWSTWGGAIDPGESHEEALKRELYEETRYNGSITEYIKWGKNIHKNVNYQAYVAIVPKEFNPTLNWENSKYRWLNIKDISKLKPKHPGFKSLLKNNFDVLEDVLKKHKIKVEKPGIISTVSSWFGANDKTGVEDPIRLKIIEMARKIAPRGLSMNIIDKEKRAKAQGYSDQVWFHGSKSTTIFTKWIIDPEKTPTSHGGYNSNLYGPGIYFAKKREVSEAYAKSVEELRNHNGMDMITFGELMRKVAQKQSGIKMTPGQLMKIAGNRKELSRLDFYEALHVRMFRIRVRKPFNCMKKFKPNDAEIELIKKYDYPVPNGRLTGAEVYSLWYESKGSKKNFHNKTRINDLLHKMGYDSIFHIGAQDSEVMIVFDVGAIRDVDACFNPARIGENNSIA